MKNTQNAWQEWLDERDSVMESTHCTRQTASRRVTGEWEKNCPERLSEIMVNVNFEMYV